MKIISKQTEMYTLETLRWAAKQKCDRKNCEGIGLCQYCSARKALELWNVSWRDQDGLLGRRAN